MLSGNVLCNNKFKIIMTHLLENEEHWQFLYFSIRLILASEKLNFFFLLSPLITTSLEKTQKCCYTNYFWLVTGIFLWRECLINPGFIVS